MAYCGSPQDLFASEDSDSEDILNTRSPVDDLTVASGPEPCHSANIDVTAVIVSDLDSMPFSGNQNKKEHSLRRYSRHTISSSDSDDDNASELSKVNRCPVGPYHQSVDSVRADELDSRNNTVANASSLQPATDVVHDRPLCKYGAKCYRKNPRHFQEFRHPGNVKWFLWLCCCRLHLTRYCSLVCDVIGQKLSKVYWKF